MHKLTHFDILPFAFNAFCFHGLAISSETKIKSSWWKTVCDYRFKYSSKLLHYEIIIESQRNQMMFRNNRFEGSKSLLVLKFILCLFYILSSGKIFSNRNCFPISSFSHPPERWWSDLLIFWKKKQSWIKHT